MRRYVLVAALLATAVIGRVGNAAIFTSTTLSTAVANRFGVRSSQNLAGKVTRTPLNGIMNYYIDVAPYTLTVDTDTDMASVGTMSAAINAPIPAQVFESSFAVDYEIVVRPPNFPDPGEKR